ncbi:MULTISPECIES: hypothetical protein [unclassified Streptomyces]|uniref:hypothetical protein n=1 Tax=unclassified Streptomyces TaxID=2593676 RepID=UPI00336AA55D
MTSQRKPRGPYRKSAVRREQILQAAYEAIDEHGEKADAVRRQEPPLRQATP